MRSNYACPHFWILVCATAVQAQLPATSQPFAASAPARPLIDRQIRRDIYNLDNLLADGHLLEAIELRRGLRSREAGLPNAFLDYLKRLDRDLASEITKREALEGDGYFLIRNSDHRTSEWADVLSEARNQLHDRSRRDLRKGTAIVWIHLEKPERERRIELEHNLPCLKSPRWMGDTFQPGFSNRDAHIFLILMKEGEAAHQSAALTIKPMQHMPVSLNLLIPEKGVRCSEVYLKLKGRDRLGQLRCHCVPEPGITLENVGATLRQIDEDLMESHQLDSNGDCLFDAIPEGIYKLQALQGRDLTSSIERHQIKPGRTIDVHVTVYARRKVTFEWMSRHTPGQGAWETGSTSMLTGDFPPNDMLVKNSRLFRIGNWGSPEPLVELYNESTRARVLPAHADDFENKTMPFTDEQFNNAPRDGLPLEVGRVLALRYERPDQQQEAEALVRIKSIEPVIAVTSAPSR